MPDVDVVMIAYNKARYIDEAIAGVMAQKGDFRLRLIVMDDCSTDATPEIIDRWRRRFPDKILTQSAQSGLAGQLCGRLQTGYGPVYGHLRCRRLLVFIA